MCGNLLSLFCFADTNKTQNNNINNNKKLHTLV